MSRDSRLRSLLKAFSWRILATLTTATIAYAVTGRLDTAALIGSIEFVLKFVIYYFHERFWQWLPERGGQVNQATRPERGEVSRA